MNETMRLVTTDPAPGLRLQAPTLTVGAGHAIAVGGAEAAGNLRWTARVGGVALCCELRNAGAGEWRLQARLANEGAVAVEGRVAYPYLFYHFETSGAVRVFDPTYGGVLEPSPLPIVKSYPGPATFCLTAAAGEAATVATGLLDREQRHAVIRHIPAGPDGQIRFLLPRVWVGAGESVDLPEQFIRVGADWGEAFAPYREFAQAAFLRHRQRPAWLTEGNFTETRKAHCLAPFQPPGAFPGVWIFDNEGRVRTLDDIKGEVDEAFADGAKKGYTPLFYQFGWWQSMADIRGLFMFDSVCGDYDCAHGLTRPVIDYIHQCGGRVYLYTNVISAGDETAVFRDHPELFGRDAAGAHVQNADYPMYMFCPGAPGLRDYWERVLQCILVELDADGLFLDQVGGGTPPCYCYAPDHRHAHPDTYGADFVALVDWIADRARQIKPDCYVGGELVLDSRSALLDETHGCGYTGIKSKLPTDEAALRNTKPPEYYAFVRHLCPQIHSSVSSRLNLMNGAAGSHAWPEWRQHRAIFESGLTPCSTEPAGALAYLFGPVAGEAILAVRAPSPLPGVVVTLPAPFALPAGGEHSAIPVAGDPRRLIVEATPEPRYYRLETGSCNSGAGATGAGHGRTT